MSDDSQPPSINPTPEEDAMPEQPPRDAFPPTSLTEVFNSLGDSANSQKALAGLCAKYWYPLYAFLRRRGHGIEDAQDLTQGFFAKFLSGKGFAGYDPRRAKLRTYMLGALKHYEASARRDRAAQKRGGGYTFVSFDWMMAEKRYGTEPAHIDSPDQIYQRRWAITLMANAHEMLRASYVKQGKEDLFDTLHVFLDGQPDDQSRESASAHLGMTPAATKMALSRMRDRRRQIIRSEIAKTVASPDLIDGEIAHLIGLFQPYSDGGCA